MARLEDRVELLARDDERPAERVVALDERAAAGEALLEAVENLLEVRLG